MSKTCKHDGRVFWNGPLFPNARAGDVYLGQIGIYQAHCAKVVERRKNAPDVTCDAEVGDPVAGPAYQQHMIGKGAYNEKHGDFVFQEGDSQKVM